MYKMPNNVKAQISFNVCVIRGYCSARLFMIIILCSNFDFFRNLLKVKSTLGIDRRLLNP